MESKTTGGTVGKALKVLDDVASNGAPIKFSDLLENSAYPKATLYRLLQTLVGERLLQYNEASQCYSLGVRLVSLAHAAWHQASLAPIAREAIDQLSRQVGETVHLAQLDGGQVLYVDKRNASRPIQMFSDAGKVGPVYCTGVGKAMLAFLPKEKQQRILKQQSYYAFTPHTLTNSEALEQELIKIRIDGVAFDREEHEPGIICIATPIKSSKGLVYGGVSITTSTQRYSLSALAEMRESLLSTAHEIARSAEAWRFPETV
ncbi:MAG TPA: IclR family transcriptional regulator [Marinobacterium sp.]|nr:IclR family transcriptional regulator [Marinobacterium sp.]